MGLFDFFSKQEPIPAFEEWFKRAFSTHFPIPTDKINYEEYKELLTLSVSDFKDLCLSLLKQLADTQPELSKVIEKDEELILITPLLPGFLENNHSLKGLAIMTDKRFFLFDNKIIVQLDYSEIDDIKGNEEIDGFQNTDGGIQVGSDDGTGYYYPALLFHKAALPLMPLERYSFNISIKEDAKKKGQTLMIMTSKHNLRNELIATFKKVKSDTTKHHPTDKQPIEQKNLTIKTLEDSNNATFYIDRGTAWRKAGELDKAIADFNTAIKLEPNNLFAYGNRGKAWEEKGELDKALADYTKAIEIDPKQDIPYIDRGLTWMKKGELDKALADFSKATELEPNYDGTYMNRAVAWEGKGELDKAMNDYNKCIELIPNNPIVASRIRWLNIHKKYYDTKNDIQKQLVNLLFLYIEAIAQKGESGQKLRNALGKEIRIVVADTQKAGDNEAIANVQSYVTEISKELPTFHATSIRIFANLVFGTVSKDWKRETLEDMIDNIIRAYDVENYFLVSDEEKKALYNELAKASLATHRLGNDETISKALEYLSVESTTKSLDYSDDIRQQVKSLITTALT